MSQSAPGRADSGSDSDNKEFSCDDCCKSYTVQDSLSAHYRSGNNNCSGVECPTCDKDHFVNERGMKCHHSRIHGESLRGVTFNCDVCGEEAVKEPHHYNQNGKNYCSHECQGKDLQQTKTVECEHCGEANTYSPPSEASRFCSRECANEHLCGEQHPSYKARIDYYGHKWKPQRERALERDGYQCQICGAGREEIGKSPHVHHITPVRKFDDPNDAHDLDNLVTLCPEHHMEWEGIPLRPI